MRQTIKILSLALLIVGGSACTKDITRFNTETKNAAVVPAGPLFTGATKSLCDGLVSAAVGTNIYRHFIKHWAQAVIQEEAQYDFVTRATHQSWWARMYRDVLNDLNESARIITEDDSMDPKVKANQLAVIDVMQVFTYNILVNTFGDVPYSQALDANNLFPAYDDAQTIYADLLNSGRKHDGCIRRRLFPIRGFILSGRHSQVDCLCKLPADKNGHDYRRCRQRIG